MANPFEVLTDNSGRIINYIPAGHPGTLVKPEAIAERIDGGERIVLDDEAEYELTETGSLVHVGVEVPDTVLFGHGVRIDEGTVLHPSPTEELGAAGRITMAKRVRVRGTEIYSGVEIGSFALILADSIGSNSVIGSYARVGEEVVVGASVEIGPTAKIDRETAIRSGAIIGRAAKIGYKTTIGVGAQIGHHAKIGKFTGEGPRGVNQDGPFINDGRVVAPKDNVQ
ncbi:MAG TPA: hypothetical protein VN554_01045 [Verrucomicrobiae bacterium]|nr:hypothetical protein [Verrucomicrobiae bacterium]